MRPTHNEQASRHRQTAARDVGNQLPSVEFFDVNAGLQPVASKRFREGDYIRDSIGMRMRNEEVIAKNPIDPRSRTMPPRVNWKRRRHIGDIGFLISAIVDRP